MPGSARGERSFSLYGAPGQNPVDAVEAALIFAQLGAQQSHIYVARGLGIFAGVDVGMSARQLGYHLAEVT